MVSEIVSWILLVLIVLWIIYWQWVHPNIRFKEKKYSKNEELLKLDHDRYSQTTNHLEISGLTFIVAGFSLLTPSPTIGLLLFAIGLLFIFASFKKAGEAARVYNCLVELYKEKFAINSKKR